MIEVKAQIVRNEITARFSNFLIPYEANFRLTAETLGDIPSEMLNDSQRLTLEKGEYWIFVLKILGSDQADSKFFIVEGGIKRTTEGTVSLIGVEAAKEVPTRDNAATWNVDVTADDVNKSLKISVTGEAGKTVTWSGRIYITKITFT